MKREGWQHGMVRCHEIMPAPFNQRKIINGFNSPPTAGIHTKVLHKPTNHSKFTGKCRKSRCLSCHLHPVSKSKDKAKGAYKIKSCDVALNHRLVSWRVVDKGYGVSYTGISATGILGYLDGNFSDEIEDSYYDENELAYDTYNGFDDMLADIGSEEEIVESSNELEDGGKDDDDDMGFQEVGFFLEYLDLDGEDWCVVKEM